MPLALFALTISAFAIGTTEFVIVGLVPTIAQQLAISLPSAGMLVSITNIDYCFILRKIVHNFV